MNKTNEPIVISIQAMQRMPYYLQYLKIMRERGAKSVAAPAIATFLNLTEIQVRKDLASVSTTGGKPKFGFMINELIANIEDLLGHNRFDTAALVGVGSLGSALLSYKGFSEYGLQIIVAFDTSEEIIGSTINDIVVLSCEKLIDVSRRMGIKVGIIAVPQKAAQNVCDTLVEAGIKAIWNFAPVHLHTPRDVLVKNENMAASLALLINHLKESSL